MPLVLQVKLLPRSQVWADLFQNDCPDLNDVALYFSPDKNIERFVLPSDFCVAISDSVGYAVFNTCAVLTYRSKENSACLFELMEVQNSMMKSCINDVELLIFTSKQLHVDSQSELSFFRSIQFSYIFSL